MSIWGIEHMTGLKVDSLGISFSFQWQETLAETGIVTCLDSLNK